MEENGVNSNRYATAIHLLVNPDHIDQTSISKDITKLSEAPILKLSQKGIDDKVGKFYAAGGNHRTKAVAIISSRLSQKIQELEAEIERLSRNTKKKSTDKLVGLQQEVANLRTKRSAVPLWTVILYDEGKWTRLISKLLYLTIITIYILATLRADGNRLALELSRNEAVVQKVEGDAEKTTMRFLEYMTRRKAMEAKSQTLSSADRDQLAKMAEKNGVTDKPLKRCFQSEEVLTYWMALASVNNGIPFFYSKHFASKWSEKVIHQPGGAVSNISGLIAVFIPN